MCVCVYICLYMSVPIYVYSLPFHQRTSRVGWAGPCFGVVVEEEGISDVFQVWRCMRVI